MYSVQTIDLTKYFQKEGGKVDRIIAVNHVNLNVEEGAFFGLLGPNGAGKTTLIKMLCTLIIPDEGTAKIAGYDVVNEPDRVKENIGWLHGETGGRALYWRLSARDNLKFYAYLQNIPSDIAGRRIEALLDFFELTKDADRLVKDFSTGMKVRVMLARTLLANAAILLMDEPTVGLDASGAIETRSLLRALCKDLQKTIFFTTHNILEAERLCDKIAVMNKGKIVAVDTPLRLSEITKSFRGVELTLLGSGETVISELQKMPGVKKVVKVQPEEDHIIIQLEVENEDEALVMVPQYLKSKGIKMIGIQKALPDLEEVFIHLTGEERVEGG